MQKRQITILFAAYLVALCQICHANDNENPTDKLSNKQVATETVKVLKSGLRRGYISGKVTDVSGNALSDVLIDVFNATTSRLISFMTTDQTGTYKISVPPGKYKLNATPFNVRFNQQLYKEAVTFEDALIIQVAPANNVENIDIRLISFYD